MTVRRLWILTGLFCLLPVVFGLGLSFLVRRLPDTGQPRENGQVWIYSGHPVSQRITPAHNGLNVVTVYLKNVSLRNREPLVFTLNDDTGVIRRLDINGYNVGDGDNVRFQFDPVADSGGRTFTFTLSSDSSRETAIGVGYDDTVRSAAFQTYYYPTSRISVLRSSVSYLVSCLLRPRFLILFVFEFAAFSIIIRKYAQLLAP